MANIYDSWSDMIDVLWKNDIFSLMDHLANNGTDTGVHNQGESKEYPVMFAKSVEAVKILLRMYFNENVVLPQHQTYLMEALLANSNDLKEKPKNLRDYMKDDLFPWLPHANTETAYKNFKKSTNSLYFDQKERKKIDYPGLVD